MTGVQRVLFRSETATVELIRKGERQGLWKFKEKANELVQKKTDAEGTPKAPSAPQKQSTK